jgi:zinc/manganese transport system substrate-binding protein
MKTAWALAAFCLGCGALPGAAETARPIRVVTLNPVLTEVVRAVGGGEVAVTGLVQAGVDPHTFNPSPSEVRSLADADLVLASGLNIEAYLGRLVASAVTTGRVVAVGDAVPLVLSTPRRDGAERDPHWWHSLGNMAFAVDLVRDELTRLRPSAAEGFRRRDRAYQERLQVLGQWVSSQVALVPPGRRLLVTSHDAFGYFAHDYGFTVHAINGLSTEGEADARHLAALVDLIRREHVRAIFVESSANPRVVENLLAETGARLGGTLYADGLGPPGSGAETFDAMYRHNVSAIVGALSGP